MKDKSKIVLIYTCVALISALILAVTFYIRSFKKQPPPEKPYVDVNLPTGPLLTLKKDIVLKNQDGEEVKLSDLKGKVWGFAQFYAECPMCAKRNGQGLKQLYEKFKGNPDFHIVCISIDPDKDDPEKLKTIAATLDANTKNWWFLTGDKQQLMDYMENEMKFQKIIKRTDPDKIATLGEYAHDMSIALFDRDMNMMDRFDLYTARQNGDIFYAAKEKQLHAKVESMLEKK